MDEEKMKKLNEALKSDESFLEFLKQGAESDDYQKLKEHVEKGPHPAREMLYDYVLNWTDKTDDEKIMDHIAFCPVCSKEVLSIMKIEHELEDDMLDWANQLPLIEKGKATEKENDAVLYGIENKVPIYHRDKLSCGEKLTGPALIIETVSTTYLAPHWQCKVDKSGCLMLRKKDNFI